MSKVAYEVPRLIELNHIIVRKVVLSAWDISEQKELQVQEENQDFKPFFLLMFLMEIYRKSQKKASKNSGNNIEVRKDIERRLERFVVIGCNALVPNQRDQHQILDNRVNKSADHINIDHAISRTVRVLPDVLLNSDKIRIVFYSYVALHKVCWSQVIIEVFWLTRLGLNYHCLTVILVDKLSVTPTKYSGKETNSVLCKVILSAS